MLSAADDPMVHEHGCSQFGVPLCFSPDCNDSVTCASPEYKPVSTTFRPACPDPHANDNFSQYPKPLAQPSEVVFGPGAQLDGPEPSAAAMDDILDRVTNMDIDETARDSTAQGTGGPANDGKVAQVEKDMYEVLSVPGEPNDAVLPVPGESNDAHQAATDAYASFAAGMFRATPTPLLQRPDLSAPINSRTKKKLAAPTRSSVRQAARPSAVPVAERAKLKLMRELEFVSDNRAPAPDAAVTAYAQLYGHGLPDAAVKVLRAATKMGNKELTKVLEAIAAEVGTAELEAA